MAEKRYRYGNWERNKMVFFTDDPDVLFPVGWKPWQRTRRELVEHGPNDTWPFDTVTIAGFVEIEYGTDEEVARDMLHQRFGVERLPHG